MNRVDIDSILEDYMVSHDRSGDPELDAVAAALFLEETFGITLSDADIDPSVLGTQVSMRSLVARSLDHA